MFPHLSSWQFRVIIKAKLKTKELKPQISHPPLRYLLLISYQKPWQMKRPCSAS